METTFSYPEFVRSLFKQDTLPLMYIHAAIGIAGEVAELKHALEYGTVQDQILETGDLMFYTQAMLNFNHLDFEQIETSLLTEQDNFISLSGAILDTIKKYAIYGQKLNETHLVDVTSRLVCLTKEFMKDMGFTFVGVRQANIAKLHARYPEGRFTTAATVARADEQMPG